MSDRPTLPEGATKYEALMGRPHIRPAIAPTEKVHLQKIRINGGGYDPQGAYWGIRRPGEYLYWCVSDDGSVDTFVDAGSRAQAIAKLTAQIPGIRFLRH